MAALLIIVGSVIAALLILAIIVRVVQFLSLLAVLMLCATCVAIGYVSLAIFGISLAILYEALGPNHPGWVFAGAGLISLLAAWQMFVVAISNIKSFFARLQCWTGHSVPNSSTQKSERTTS